MAMLRRGEWLTKQAFAKIIRSCSSRPKQLKNVHALILTTGLSIKNSLVTQLLENFVTLGDMVYARKLFDQMYKPRVYLWTTLIRGYVKNQLPEEASSVYTQMLTFGIRPDEFTYPFVIKAFVDKGEFSNGLALHAHVVTRGLEFGSVVRTELMIMYVKFGELGLAESLFVTMEERDLVAWNAIIAACVQMGHASKALELFCQMRSNGVQCDSVTLVAALSSCGQLGCLEMGEEIYDRARKEGIESNTLVENARLDMYVKCGSVEKARTLFDEMNRKSVVSWSTMIVGYAMNGESEEALKLFSRMQNEGLRPNYVTYLGVLSACSHAGLVNEGLIYFNRMSRSNEESIQPRKEHYSCMIDLLGRSGHLGKAYEFLQSMPMEPDAGILGALLGACMIHNNLVLGQKVADMLLEVAPDIASYHLLLSNIYASAGRWDFVDKVRRKMRKRGVKKIAAYSSIGFGDKIHVFHCGDRSHPQSDAIHRKLGDLLKQIKSMGYVPRTNLVFHDVEMEEKEASVSVHSEKIAIVFGIINLPQAYPIRVMKNLRICDDCHTFSKFVSRVTDRVIIMRDKNRFHHFRGGICSCRDFW